MHVLHLYLVRSTVINKGKSKGIFGKKMMSDMKLNEIKIERTQYLFEKLPFFSI